MDTEVKYRVQYFTSHNYCGKEKTAPNFDITKYREYIQHCYISVGGAGLFLYINVFYFLHPTR